VLDNGFVAELLVLAILLHSHSTYLGALSFFMSSAISLLSARGFSMMNDFSPSGSSKAASPLRTKKP